MLNTHICKSTLYIQPTYIELTRLECEGYLQGQGSVECGMYTTRTTGERWVGVLLNELMLMW
jgi:hypothetical protein